MKKLLLPVVALFSGYTALAQCNTNTATSCVCENSTQINCDLLPDITLSWWALQNYSGGPTEYSQNGNGADDGRLRITGSTPNIGYGPFTVRGVDDQGKRWFVCGTDTFSINDPNSIIPFTCPNTSQTARQLLVQRVYYKNGNSMTYEEHFTGTMTFHPTHYHNHVDDWVVFTLRLQDPLEMDPRNWPIIGNGAKVGFCLMDYGTCQMYGGHCRTDNTIVGQGTILSSPADFPNYGLGGGNYSCSPTEQGISVGYTDIYDESLDGMWIDIPDGTCNGNYWIVGEVDPHNVFLESNDNNNWTAIPVTLTQQSQNGGSASIVASSSPIICGGESITLTANPGTAYSWSTGATTQTITVNTPGNYSVAVTNQCGTATSAPLAVSTTPAPSAPAAIIDATCAGNSAILTAAAAANQTVKWYSASGQWLSTGNSYTTQPLNANTNFLVSTVQTAYDSARVGPVTNTIGSGGFLDSNQGLVFDAYSPFTLRSVKVYAQTAGPRTIMLLSSSGTVISSATVTLPAGESRTTLNFDIQPGSGYRLSTTNGNLFRNNSGTAYPYAIADFVSITTSTAGNGFYYFFYDWDVKRKLSECESTKSPVSVSVVSPSAVTFSGLSTDYYSNSTSSVLTGSPAGGVFSGLGVNGNVFDPAAAGPGTHSIVYTYQLNNCQITVNHETEVHNFVGRPEEFDYNHSISLFPNPSNGMFTFEVNAPGNVTLELSLLDLVGRTIQHKTAGEITGKHTEQINAVGLSAGTYIMKATIGGRVYIRKVIIN